MRFISLILFILNICCSVDVTLKSKDGKEEKKTYYLNNWPKCGTFPCFYIIDKSKKFSIDNVTNNSSPSGLDDNYICLRCFDECKGEFIIYPKLKYCTPIPMEQDSGICNYFVLQKDNKKCFRCMKYKCQGYEFYILYEWNLSTSYGMAKYLRMRPLNVRDGKYVIDRGSLDMPVDGYTLIDIESSKIYHKNKDDKEVLLMDALQFSNNTKSSIKIIIIIVACILAAAIAGIVIYKMNN